MLKKLLFVSLVVLLLATPVFAMETTTYSGTAGHGWYHLPIFTTYRDGDIVATAYFPVQQRAYGVYVHSMTSDLYCINHVDNRWGRGNYSQVSCTISNAPAGTYEAEFSVSSGKSAFTLEIVAETNP